MTVTRQRQLWGFANLCASPPPVVDAMRIADFAHLVAGLMRHAEAVAKANQAAS